MSGPCEYEPRQEQGFLKKKLDIKKKVQVDVSDMKGESVVRAGSKQDPKTFKSSSNLDIKVQFNRRK